jgi:hypothetical protein
MEVIATSMFKLGEYDEDEARDNSTDMDGSLMHCEKS